MTRIILVAAIVAVCQAEEFEIINHDGEAIWIGIQENNGKPALEDGGFVLGAGQSRTIQAADDWSGRFWGRTWCADNSKHCLTGDCGNKMQCGGSGGAPPATLAEITLKGSGGLDYYDISLVDGFNVKVQFEPVGGTGDGGQYSCKKAQCTANVNQDCPDPLKIKNGSTVIGCQSACAHFNTDEYCCRGAHDKPETCKSSTWPQDYPAFFKKECPDAYSYAYDDNKSTFTCKSSKYRITFG